MGREVWRVGKEAFVSASIMTPIRERKRKGGEKRRLVLLAHLQAN